MIPWRVNLPRYDTQASQSPQVWYPDESISPGYFTTASHSPRGMIPWWVNKKSAKTWLPGIWYPSEKGGGRRFFSQIEPNWPLPYTVQYRASTVPVPQFQSFSICMSAMTRAQNMAAKGSILDEDQALCLSGYDLSMVCPVQMKWISLRVWWPVNPLFVSGILGFKALLSWSGNYSI